MSKANQLLEVSIIITTYNYAQFLGEAISSCLVQSDISDITVVDDGSTDDPASIVRNFPTVSIVSQSRNGVSEARNLGLRSTAGNFLVFLDADDRLLPDAISNLLLCFESQPSVGLAYGACRRINSAGDVLAYVREKRLGKDPYRRLLFGNTIGMHSNVMYRRECFRRCGVFDPEMQACADLDMFLRVAMYYDIVSTGKVVADYRKHDVQMSADPSRMVREGLAVVKKHARIGRCEPSVYRLAGNTWKRWYCFRYAERVWREIRVRRLSMQEITAGFRLFSIAPLSFVIALISPSRAARKLGVRAKS